MRPTIDTLRVEFAPGTIHITVDLDESSTENLVLVTDKV